MEKCLTSQGPKERASYTITLPKEWVKAEKLDKTKKVELIISGNKLIISKEKEQDERIVIKTDDYIDSLKKVVPGIYRIGINEVEFIIKNPKILEEISKIINERLIGFEVIEKKGSSIIVKDITKESEESFKNILRRIFLLTIELSESKDKIQARILELNIKRLINYCQRVLIKKSHAEFTKTPIYYLLLDQIEKLSNELKWLIELKNKPDKLNDIIELLKNAYLVFYKYSPKLFNDYCQKAYDLKEITKKEKNISISTIYVHNLARQINSIYGTIFQLKFNE